MLIFLHTFAYQCWFGLSCRGKRRFWSWRTCVLRTTPTTAASPPSEMCVGSLTAVLSSDSPIRQVLYDYFHFTSIEYPKCFKGKFDIIPGRLQYKTATSTKGVLIKVKQTWRRKDGSGAQSLSWHNCQSCPSSASLSNRTLHALPPQPRRPSSCWWRILSWWIPVRRYPWCASPRAESRPRLSLGWAVMTACHRGAWWRGARSLSQPSAQTRRGSTAASPATTWETRRRSPLPSWCEVRRHDCTNTRMEPHKAWRITKVEKLQHCDCDNCEIL